MARKTLTFVATEGRDEGKTYLITEKSAFAAEHWAMRVAMAAMAAGVNLPDKDHLQGVGGIVTLSLSLMARIPWETAKPLLDEMLECVEAIPDPKKPFIKRVLVDSDIEEVATLATLRKEIIGLHTDFFGNAAKSISGE